jgi:hypothetical protein
MPKGLLTFKQMDLRRAIKAFQKLGLPIARAEIDRDGKIVVVVGEGKAQDSATDLERWLASKRAKHADTSEGT